MTGVFVKDEVCLPDPRTDFDATAGVSNASTAEGPEANGTACVGTNLIVATAMSLRTAIIMPCLMEF